jgi:hypothetical protein
MIFSVYARNTRTVADYRVSDICVLDPDRMGIHSQAIGERGHVVSFRSCV